MQKKKESYANANKVFYETLDEEYRSDYEKLARYGAPKDVLDTIVEEIKKTDASFYNSKNEYDEIRHKPINIIKYSNALNEGKSERTAELVSAALSLLAFGLLSSLEYSFVVNNAPLVSEIVIGLYMLFTMHLSGSSIKHTVDAIKKICKYEPVVEDAYRINNMKERVRK